MSDLTTLSVGQPHPGLAVPAVERVQYQYDRGGHQLVMVLPGLTPAEIADVRIGQASFAVGQVGPVLFFLYRFGRSIPWSDAPYSWHLVDPARRVLPDTAGMREPRALLNVVLAEAPAAIVRGLRVVSMAPSLTTMLHLVIRDQAAAPWVGQEAYDAALAEAYQRYPTTRDLLKIARARTEGGR